MVFETIIQNMQTMGFFQYLFPFLLALAVLYGVMTMALKDKMPKNAIALVSLILSFFVMLFVSANPGIVGFLMNISGYWLVVGCGILFLIVLLGMFGIHAEDIWKGKENVWGKWVLILVVLVIAVVIFFGAGGEALVGVPSGVFSSELWTIVFFIVILALVMFVMGKEGGGGEKTKAPV
ncbi:MAG: hypothetical protein V3V26_02120 [Candidatus Aenigmarchaeota archaeon]